MAVVINGTTGITSVNGSAAAPSVTGADTDTGIVYGTNTLSLATGGTTAVTVDSSQNVGIGTSSPVSKLHAYGSGQIGTIESSGNYATSGAGYVRWKDVNGNAAFVGFGGNANNFDIYNSLAGALTFHTNATERARIDSSGNLLVGKTSTSDSASGFMYQPTKDGAGHPRLTLTDDASTNSYAPLLVFSAGAVASRFYVGMGGTVYATSTTITGISDQRLKENIRDLEDGLDKVLALKPRKFDWKENKGKGIANDRGFIAQEFEQVFPDMIEEWQDPAPEGEEPYKAVNANLVPTLVKAIQEQQALITTLTERITALEAK